MLIARSPLRISIGGGGTYLPSYYEKFGGFLLAGAIDKYVYLTLHESFVDYMILKYSQLEHAKSIPEIKHPLFREALTVAGIDTIQLEMASMADIPAGTGLGSSGSFITALLKVLYTYKKELLPRRQLAETACEIEINRLKQPVGKQDQYIAAVGGITCFDFKKDGTVDFAPLKITEETVFNLEDNLILFFTGYSRDANEILKEQDDSSKTGDQSMIDNLHYVKELGYRIKDALEVGDLNAFGVMMNEHWEHKKRRSSKMSNPQIDKWYQLALENGAVGGKLIGAGGGGFLMFYTENKRRLRRALNEAGLKEVRFKFDFEGTKIIV